MPVAHLKIDDKLIWSTTAMMIGKGKIRFI
jgi:hypothetical protein